MRLQRMTLHNFMGHRAFTLEPNGEDLNIYGDNGAGKTTLNSAMQWLLFGKDAEGRTDFAIKTFQPGTDKPIPGIDHEVEAEFDCITLKRVFQEKWTKPRGKAEALFTGHTTLYSVNGVPVQEKEYKDQVGQIIQEDIFRMLTDPKHFCERIKWEDRRAVLMGMAGEPGDEEVIQHSPDLADLRDILGKNTIEDHRKIVTARRQAINKELTAIPVRVDEATRALPECKGSPTVVANELADLKEQRADKEREMVQIRAGGGVAEKTKQLREIESALMDARNKSRGTAEDKVGKAKAELEKIKDRKVDLFRQSHQAGEAIAQHTARIEADNLRLEQLRDQAAEVIESAFEACGADVKKVCPTCAQELPDAQIAAAMEKAETSFNTRKATELERIRADGKAMKYRMETSQAAIDSLTSQIKEWNAEADKLNNQEADLQIHIDETKAEFVAPTTEDPETTRLQGQKAAVEAEIAKLQTGTDEAISLLKEKVAVLESRIGGLETILAAHKSRESGLKRIDELGAQQKALAEEYEKLERENYLCDRFVVAKVELLEEKINGLFSLTRFRMFETQVNGGIDDRMCTPMGRSDTGAWVPYNAGLNGGMRTNVGLDCINTLADHYDFDCPIWIDEAGEVTQLLPTLGQQIRLYVSKQDKTLRIENTMKEEVAA